jgi:hypothetical protein
LQNDGPRLRPPKRVKPVFSNEKWNFRGPFGIFHKPAKMDGFWKPQFIFGGAVIQELTTQTPNFLRSER